MEKRQILRKKEDTKQKHYYTKYNKYMDEIANLSLKDLRNAEYYMNNEGLLILQN